MSNETPNDTHLENYVRRYANDRDDLSEIEDAVTEAVPVSETSDDVHLEDYIRRYGNDR